MSNIVSFKDVSLNFGGVKALNNVSFDIKEGSLHAIIGPNGAGKTSIFNCISGIYKPTSGHVEFKGENIQGLRPDEIANKGVARTFQNIELFENMTVLDNILIGAHRHIDYGSISGILFGPSVREKEIETLVNEAKNEAIKIVDNSRLEAENLRASTEKELYLLATREREKLKNQLSAIETRQKEIKSNVDLFEDQFSAHRERILRALSDMQQAIKDLSLLPDDLYLGSETVDIAKGD